MTNISAVVFITDPGVVGIRQLSQGLPNQPRVLGILRGDGDLYEINKSLAEVMKRKAERFGYDPGYIKSAHATALDAVRYIRNILVPDVGGLLDPTVANLSLTQIQEDGVRFLVNVVYCVEDSILQHLMPYLRDDTKVRLGIADNKPKWVVYESTRPYEYGQSYDGHCFDKAGLKRPELRWFSSEAAAQKVADKLSAASDLGFKVAPYRLRHETV